MTEQQIRKLLQQALYKAQIDGPCYDVSKLVIQLELAKQYRHHAINTGEI